MTLNTKAVVSEKTVDATIKDAASQLQPAAPVQTVLLELALYNQYNKVGTLFVKGKAYRFTREDALRLLDEKDYGRPIWKVYHPPKPKTAPSNVVDATSTKIPEEGEPIHGIETAVKPLAEINIGSEDELAGLLPPEEGEGNVTV